MPLYRVLQDSYINDRYVMAGSVVDYTPPKAVAKLPPNATPEQKAMPHYKDTVVGSNLELIEGDVQPHEIARPTVTREA